MPRAELIITNEPSMPKFILDLNLEDIIILVKDKFINWKDHVCFKNSFMRIFLINFCACV